MTAREMTKSTKVAKGNPVNYQLGRLGFSIRGYDPIVNPLRDEFSPIETTADKESTLEYVFTPDFPDIDPYTHLPPLLVSKAGFQVKSNQLEYQVRTNADKTQVFVNSSIRKWLTDRIPGASRFKDWNYLSKEETQAKNFMYNIFDYITQIENLKVGQTFIHASAMEKDGAAVLLSAWGGIGKTSSMVKLVKEDGWNFLSDDLSLIDESGLVSLVPKKMQIYAYNVKGEIGLEKALFQHRAPLDRLSWRYHLRKRGAKGVRRRIAAHELLGSDRISNSAKLRTVIHLRRSSGDQFKRDHIPSEALVDACTHTLLEELKPFPAIATAIRVAGQNTEFPTISEFCERTNQVITRAFSDVDHLVLNIPLTAGPTEVVKELKTVLD